MAVVLTPKAVPFNGIANMRLKTLTNAYPFILTGWQFNKNAQRAMESIRYANRTLTPFTPTGIHNQLMDTKTMFTNTRIGETTLNSQLGSLSNPTYDAITQRLMWWDAINNGPQPIAVVTSYSCIYGDNNRAFSLRYQANLGIGTTANTGGPYTPYGVNRLGPRRTMYAGAEKSINLGAMLFGIDDNSTVLKVGVQGFVDIGANSLGWSAANDKAIYFLNTSGAAYNLVETDLSSYTLFYKLTFQNPAQSTFDFNTFFTTNNNWLTASSNDDGFTYTVSATHTVNGITMAGFSVFFPMDFSYYTILNYIPMDASAALWNSGSSGQKQLKSDNSGALIMKQTNSNVNLFSATYDNTKILNDTRRLPMVDLPNVPFLYK